MNGFVQFDPDKWEPEASGEASGRAKAAKPAKLNEPALATLATLARLPHDLADGLKRLSQMAPPRLLNPNAWPVVVADAQWLASEGLACRALSLGWQPMDIFGAVPDKDGDPAASGLAVKLEGRRILAICSEFARVRDRDGKRSWIRPGNNSGAVLLWELGRIQRPNASPPPQAPTAAAV